VYEPDYPEVKDEFATQLVRPIENVSTLVFQNTTPWGFIVNAQTGIVQVGTDIDSNSGTVRVPPLFNQVGKFGFCQKVVSSVRTPPPLPPKKASYTNALDGTFPYAFYQQDYTCGIAARFHDTPWWQGPPTVSATDSFEVTLMFLADSQGANWVPLKKATWGWTASITAIPFATPVGSHTGPPAWVATATHPTWTEVANLGGN
jgi:hypothetical protein